MSMENWKKKEPLFWQVAALCLYGIMLTKYILMDSVVQYTIVARLPKINSYYLWLRLFAIVLLLAKISRGSRFTWKEIGISALLGIALIRCVQVVSFGMEVTPYEYDELIDLLILIVAMREVPFRNILKVYVAIGGVLVLGIGVLSQIGKVEDWILLAWNSAGKQVETHALGFLYPNEYAAHVFFLSAAWIALRGKKTSYAELILLMGLSVLIFRYTNARTGVISTALLVIGVAAWKLLTRFTAIEQSKAGTVFSIVLGVLPVVLCVGMLVLTWRYDWYSGTMMRLDQFFSTRLSLGKTGIQNYGIHPFGQYIQMVGMTRDTDFANYNYIDCSYVSILLRFGLAAFAAFAVAMEEIIRKACKRKDVLFLGVLVLVFLQCAMEDHFQEIAYNPFLLALFAGMEQKIER